MLDVSCAVKNEAFGAPTHTRHSQNLSPKTRNLSYAASESKAKKKVGISTSTCAIERRAAALKTVAA